MDIREYLKGRLAARREREAKYLVLKNVAIPLVLDESFMAPDLETALKYYPNWRKYSGLDWEPQGYLSAIMTEIDRVKPNGYTSEQAVGELLVYLGMAEFALLMAQGSELDASLRPEITEPTGSPTRPLK